MEENKNVNFEENAPAEAAPKKENIKEKFARKKAEIAAKRAEKKANKAEKPKINKKKILGGIGIAALAIGSVAAAVATSKRCGSDEVYDPDWECEPGDDFPEMNVESESTEGSDKEVTEE